MKNKIFGTDGIRSKIGSAPLDLSVSDLAFAIATWIEKKNSKKKSILIATDTRNSSTWIKAEIKSKLLLFPNIIYDGSILPTPLVFHLIAKKKLFDFGIIITASHNPFHDNGIKIVTQDGKIYSEDESEIEEILFKKSFKEINYLNLGSEKIFKNIKYYTDDLKNEFKDNFLKNYKIILDCANGATEKIAPKIFKSFGAKIKTIHSQSNGFNINKNCGSTHTDMLKNLLLKERADFAVAFDGDGDRVVIINRNGDLKDGDDILKILSEHPKYISEKILVSTITSNKALELDLKNKNKFLVKSDVGDKNVLKDLQINGAILGAESSGHIILRDFLECSDGIFAALKTLESAILNKNLELNSIKKFPSITKNLRINQKKDLNSEPLKSIIEKANSEFKNSKLIIRYSGTEPILRILAESEDIILAQKIVDDLSCNLNIHLNNSNKITENEK